MGQNFAHNFAGLRHKAGISQRQAAEELKISQALLSHYENGLREPKLEFIVRACEYYGVTADYLLGRVDGYTSETAALVDAAADIISHINSKYGDQMGKRSAEYVSIALYKFAVCNNSAEAARCSAQMAEREAEMLEVRNADTDNAEWLKTAHPKLYDEIVKLIKGLKQGDEND